MKMKKADMARELTKIKIAWWEITDGKNHQHKQGDLYKALMKGTKKDIERDLENYEGKMERAKIIAIV